MSQSNVKVGTIMISVIGYLTPVVADLFNRSTFAEGKMATSYPVKIAHR